MKCHDTGKLASRRSREEDDSALRATSRFVPLLLVCDLFRSLEDEIMHHACCKQLDAAIDSTVVD